jgi:hypothetical protein
MEVMKDNLKEIMKDSILLKRGISNEKRVEAIEANI